jgi:membrane protein implicated in regulation of membrane protease activity
MIYRDTIKQGVYMALLAATYTFGDALLTVLEIALLFLWIYLVIIVFADIFRSHDLSGWAKALWVLLIIFLPLLGVLIYLIARGHKMHEHAEQDATAQDAAVRQYIRTAASTPADDIAKLEDLKNRGVISEDEFQRAKAKALT